MKHHDGERRVNKLDGGKQEARRRFHKARRRAGRRAAEPEHWILCDDCTTPIRHCSCECERTEDHHVVNVPHPNWRKPHIYPTLCSQCAFERERAKPGFKI